MTQAIRDYLADLENVQDKWNLTVVNPFHLAYTTAFKGFEKTLNAQKKLEELKVTLAFAGLSIVGGGILTAAFGKAALSNAVKEVSIDTICRNNWTRAFNMAAMVEGSPTASFILGSAFNTVVSQGNAAAIGRVKSSMGQFDASSYTPDPGSMKTSLQQFVLHAKTKAHDFGASVRDSGCSPALMDAFASNLKRAEFYRPPLNSIDDGNLAEYLELTFYMTLVINSDYLITRTATANSVTATFQGGPKVPISQAPGAADYPTGGTERTVHKNFLGFTSGHTVKTTSVEYEGIGSKIKARTDELHKKHLRTTFFDGRNDAQEVAKAHSSMKELAPKTFDRVHALQRLH